MDKQAKVSRNESASVQAEFGEKYEIIDRLGSGGAGTVFRVYDKRLGKIWAAKQVKQNCPGMEMQALSKVSSFVFPRIVDVVYQENFCYLIMDWIEGETLEKRIVREGAASAEEVTRIGIALCKAVGMLHSMQPPLLYLDLKPSNIMMDTSGNIRLIDLGSMVEAGEPMAVPISASPGYAAPEQAAVRQEQRKVDVRTDVFGLGRTLYALLTGIDISRPPYAVQKLRAGNPDLPRELIAIVEKCMAFSPEERYQTMEAVCAALENFAEKGQRPVFIRKVRQWLLNVLSAVVLVLLLGLTVWRAFIFYQAVISGNRAGQMPAFGQSMQLDSQTLLLLRSLLQTVACGSLTALWQRFVMNNRRIPKPEFEILQSVMRTEKQPGRWLFLILLVLLLGGSEGMQTRAKAAQLTEVQTSGLHSEKSCVTIRDVKLRKLLIKNKAVIELEEPLYLELNPDALGEEGEVEIAITVTGLDYEEVKHFQLRCCVIPEDVKRETDQ